MSVTAESPLVDVKQSARQTNIRAEQIELLPHGRDFTTLVTQAPGANQEAKLGGLSIDGASAGENRYIIDGIETTNLQSGLSGKNLIADFVEEVQVKSSGYTAEFGGAMGGVINAVTKSGTNDFHGTGAVQLPGQRLERRSRRQTFASPPDAPPEPDQLATAPSTSRIRKTTAPASSPASRSAARSSSNRAWFFGAYQPALTSTTARVDAVEQRQPGSQRRLDRAEAAGPVHHRQHDGAAQRQPARARRLQQQLGARRTACCRR